MPHQAAPLEADPRGASEVSRASAAEPRATSGLRRLLRPGVEGLRQNLLPGLFLQLAALGVLLAYFTSPDFARVLDAVGALKVRFGFGFSMVTTALAGGVVPLAILLFTRRLQPERVAPELAFSLVYWALKGVEADALYRGQAWLFGAEATLGVVVSKVAFDQLIWNPFWAAPAQAFVFLWKAEGYSFERTAARLRNDGVLARVLMVLLPTWGVWLPAVAVIYAMPQPLQLPLFNLVLCFWSLLVAAVASHRD